MKENYKKERITKLENNGKVEHSMKKAASWLKLIWQVFWPVLFIEVLSYALVLPLYPAWDAVIITILTDFLAFICLYPFYLRGIRRRAAMELEERENIWVDGYENKWVDESGNARDMDARYSGTARFVWKDAVFLTVFAVTSCIVLNECINLFGISGWSDSYEQTNEVLYSGGLLQQILLIAAAAPLAEELIFRGICYERLREHAGAAGACLVSALWFGVFHGNLVQGIYGFAMGLLLALVYEKYGGLAASVWFHAAANLTSVLITHLIGLLPAKVPLLGFVLVLFTAAIVMGNCIRIALRPRKTEVCNSRETRNQ